MDWKIEKEEIVTRLSLCLIIALVLYYGGEKVCSALKLPYWEEHRTWLEKNRIQAVALAAAVLFGISLAVLPPDKGEKKGAVRRGAAPPPSAPQQEAGPLEDPNLGRPGEWNTPSGTEAAGRRQ